jgi:3-oxoacyl-[acyl-carrier protein] reductase
MDEAMRADSIFGLTGKVVLVTGASSGLGARFAKVAATNGAKVVLVGRRLKRLEDLKADIEASGGAALAVAADVTEAAAIASSFDAAEAAFGTVDVLVANAGTASWGRISEIKPQDWRRVMDTNLDAAVWWSLEAARRLVEAQRRGSIITISSIAGLLVPGGLAAYGVSKSALISATKLMAQEYGQKGVRVNSIAPGWIMSEMTADYLGSADGVANTTSLPLGRHGDPSDLDGAFLLLASDAGRHITGMTLVVDGGDLVR